MRAHVHLPPFYPRGRNGRVVAEGRLTSRLVAVGGRGRNYGQSGLQQKATPSRDYDTTADSLRHLRPTADLAHC